MKNISTQYSGQMEDTFRVKNSKISHGKEVPCLKVLFFLVVLAKKKKSTKIWMLTNQKQYYFKISIDF